LPFDPGDLWAVGPSGDSVPVLRRPGVVLLYVTEECPHCRRELRSWQARVVAAGAAHLPLLVLSPSSDVGDPTYLPDVFRRRWVHDREGRIAAALGVEAVPLTVVFGSGGRVVAAHTGRSSEEDIDDLLRVLNPAPREKERR
jgi:peroxiredoxin